MQLSAQSLLVFARLLLLLLSLSLLLLLLLLLTQAPAAIQPASFSACAHTCRLHICLAPLTAAWQMQRQQSYFLQTNAEARWSPGVISMCVGQGRNRPSRMMHRETAKSTMAHCRVGPWPSMMLPNLVRMWRSHPLLLAQLMSTVEDPQTRATDPA